MNRIDRKTKFIEKATILHNGKYSYDDIEYINSEYPIVLECPIHGKFSITPHSHKRGIGCPYCSRSRVHKDEFIRKSNKVHNMKYDYSKVDFKNTITPVIITCPTHGDFLQTPQTHMSGSGCLMCGHIAVRKKLFGVGYNSSITCEPKNSMAYRIWRGMLERCYNFPLRNKAYVGCSVCEEWWDFANFKKWFDVNYIEGWQLDKDILVKGNKVYSPDTCCFVPQEINTFFTSCRARRGSYPLGVSFVKSKNKFVATLSIDNKNKTLGHFDNCDEAFEVYKHAKEQQLSVVANRWRDKLPDNVYKALVNYKISKND